ncbi:sodium- and chloride-dependent GABA transporter 2-like [Tachypleus tridentatus]
MTIVCLYNIHHVVTIAWTLFYFVFSMTTQLPWESCGLGDSRNASVFHLRYWFRFRRNSWKLQPV